MAHAQIAKRVLMCRADAYVRACAAPPPTQMGAFLASVYRCRSVREFLVTPQAPHGTFGDAGWMASDLDALQARRRRRRRRLKLPCALSLL